MTLLREIQGLLERTYAPIDLNLEECLITRDRCRDLTLLAGESAEGLAPHGRTFVRQSGECLYLAIFYAPLLISRLEENDPRASLNERNIAPLITFIEEIAHGIQAALLFRERTPDRVGSEAYLRNLEAQAKIDTCLVLFKFVQALLGGPIPTGLRRRLRGQVFDRSYRSFPTARLRTRYRAAQFVAQRFLKRLRAVPMEGRQEELRRFRALSWSEKLAACVR